MATFNSATVGAAIIGASGTTALVAAQGAGKRIYVVRIMLTTDTDCTVQIKSGTNVLTGVIPIAARAGWRDGMTRLQGDMNDCLFKTNANEALNLTQSTAAVIGGYLTYFVDA